MLSKAVLGWMFGALIGTSIASSASSAAAQARQAVAISGAPVVSVPSTARPIEDDRSRDRDRTPMGRASVGLNVGMAGTGAAHYTLEVDNVSADGSIGSRRGLYLALPIHVGGDGFGWTFSPFLSRSSVARNVKDANGYVTGSTDTALSAYGLYTGPVYHFQVAQPLYLGIGAGIKLAYISNDTFEYAGDAYGRIPLSATYYLSDQLAVVIETGFGYGVSAFVDENVGDLNVVGVSDEVLLTRMVTNTNQVRTTDEEPQFGKAFTWDFSVGVRLP